MKIFIFYHQVSLKLDTIETVCDISRVVCALLRHGVIDKTVSQMAQLVQLSAQIIHRCVQVLKCHFLRMNTVNVFPVFFVPDFRCSMSHRWTSSPVVWTC